MPHALDTTSIRPLAEPTTTLSPDKVLQTGLAFFQSKVLLTAVSLNVFGTLAGGSLPAVALRERLGLHERGTRDFLDALVALGFLEREDAADANLSRYRNAPEADLFLDPAKPSYIGGIMEMADARLFGHWDRLGVALRTGEAQNEARHGEVDFFARIYADPSRLDKFLRAMTGISRGANCIIAGAGFDWSSYRTFADLGTAQGDLAVQIAKANPHLTGIGYDLPTVAPIFERYVAANGLSDRVAFQAGDFFAQPMPRVDVITMGHILHDWDLAQKRDLIRKAYEALPVGGALIAYDCLIDDARRTNAFGLLMSLNMLIETRGGFDYTGADGCRWFREAGFREARVQHLVGPDSMVVGIK